MNYLPKLLAAMDKSPVSLMQFNTMLTKSDTFFEDIELEKELLISNGLPLHFTDEFVMLKTSINTICDQTFCIVDIETTAGNANAGQIIEIGAVKYRNGQIIEVYESLVNTAEIPWKIQELTGISPEMTHNAPNLRTVLEEFKIFLEDDVFVAHAISFDYKFISDSFKKYDLGELYNRRICTIAFAKKVIECERYGLKYLTEYLDIEIENHHRALSDALSTQKILKICLEKVQSHKNMKNIEDLIRFIK